MAERALAEGAARAKAWRPKSEDDHLARNTRWCRGKDEEREGEGKEEERNRWRRKGETGRAEARARSKRASWKVYYKILTRFLALSAREDVAGGQEWQVRSPLERIILTTR